jgi:ABC-2 type transport system permease protein
LKVTIHQAATRFSGWRGSVSRPLEGFRRAWAYRNLILQFTQKEIKLRYARSFFGWVWSLMNPASILVMYVMVFGIFLKVNPSPAGNGQRSYALFVFSAVVPWNFFLGVTRNSMRWLIAASPLMHKVYFPAEAPIIAGSLTVSFQTLSEAVVLIVALGLFGNISWVSLMFIPLFASLFLFAMGLALAISIAWVYFRDMEWFVEIATTLLFFITPVFYPIEIVPEQIWGFLPIRDIVLLNPLTQFVQAWRSTLYGLEMPDLPNLLGLVAVSACTYLGGSILFARFADRITEEL